MQGNGPWLCIELPEMARVISLAYMVLQGIGLVYVKNPIRYGPHQRLERLLRLEKFIDFVF